jgi:hypothetical protein
MYSCKSKTVAVWLAVFFGYFGLHRFYVGKVKSGLLWLFTFGLFGIGWIVDVFSIAFGKFTDKYGLLLNTEKGSSVDKIVNSQRENGKLKQNSIALLAQNIKRQYK